MMPLILDERRDIAPCFTLHVEVLVRRSLRVWLALFLLRLAAWVGNIGLVEGEGE